MKRSKILMVACIMIVAILSPLLAQNVTNEVHAEVGEIHALGGIGFGWRGLESAVEWNISCKNSQFRTFLFRLA